MIELKKSFYMIESSNGQLTGKLSNTVFSTIRELSGSFFNALERCLKITYINF